MRTLLGTSQVPNLRREMGAHPDVCASMVVMIRSTRRYRLPPTFRTYIYAADWGSRTSMGRDKERDGRVDTQPSLHHLFHQKTQTRGVTSRYRVVCGVSSLISGRRLPCGWIQHIFSAAWCQDQIALPRSSSAAGVSLYRSAGEIAAGLWTTPPQPSRSSLLPSRSPLQAALMHATLVDA